MADDPDKKPDPKPATGDDPDKDLGDKGEKALREERAARREAEKRASELESRLKELEDRDKSDSQKLADRAAEAERRAQEAESRAMRLEVATEKGLTAAQAKRLVGTTREELEADAEELVETFKPSGNGDGDEPRGDKPSPTNRPEPTLRGGGDPTQDNGKVDLRKVVADIPRS